VVGEVGKTDGTAKGGKRCFEALPKQGGFTRGTNVQVGDFPERDMFDDSDEDELQLNKIDCTPLLHM
jgi:hypothetical protein